MPATVSITEVMAIIRGVKVPSPKKIAEWLSKLSPDDLQIVKSSLPPDAAEELGVKSSRGKVVLRQCEWCDITLNSRDMRKHKCPKRPPGKRGRKPSSGAPSKSYFEWTEESVALLGTGTDKEIASRLGISTPAVAYKRLRSKIPAFGRATTST